MDLKALNKPQLLQTYSFVDAYTSAADAQYVNLMERRSHEQQDYFLRWKHHDEHVEPEPQCLKVRSNLERLIWVQGFLGGCFFRDELFLPPSDHTAAWTMTLPAHSAAGWMNLQKQLCSSEFSFMAALRWIHVSGHVGQLFFILGHEFHHGNDQIKCYSKA